MGNYDAWAQAEKRGWRPNLQPHGDEVTYVFTQTLRRVTRPTNSALLEPRHKQDLSANPYRTAPTLFTDHFDLFPRSRVQNKSINKNDSPVSQLDQAMKRRVVLALE
jgi:hypothetical protein